MLSIHAHSWSGPWRAPNSTKIMMLNVKKAKPWIWHSNGLFFLRREHRREAFGTCVATFEVKDFKPHRIHVWYIYANMWGILMVNVTIHSTHGSYGNYISNTHGSRHEKGKETTQSLPAWQLLSGGLPANRNVFWRSRHSEERRAAYRGILAAISHDPSWSS